MTEASTISIVVDKQGRKWRVLPDGTRVPYSARQATRNQSEAITGDEAGVDMSSDSVAPLLAAADVARLLKTPRVREVRERLGLTVDEFAHQFALAPHLIRKWEKGTSDLGQAESILLAAIASHPDAVRDAIRQYRLVPDSELEDFFADPELTELEPAQERSTPGYRAAG